MRRPIHSVALISAFFDSLLPEQREPAQALHRTILAAGPHLRAEVKWGNLCYQDNGENLISIVFHKYQAHLQILNGAQLVPRFPMLEGMGRGMRLIKVKYKQPIDEELVKSLTLASIAAQAEALRRRFSSRVAPAS